MSNSGGVPVVVIGEGAASAAPRDGLAGPTRAASVEAARRSDLVGAMIVALVMLVAGVGFLLVSRLGAESRPLPGFESLALRPDPALKGSIAYFSNDNGCVRVRGASGTPVRNALCLADFAQPNGSNGSGGEDGRPLVGPQLRWLRDGRLEVTMFRPSSRPGRVFDPGWQRVVDVSTGEVQDVPARRVSSRPNVAGELRSNDSGQRLFIRSDPDSGHVEVSLVDQFGMRTLMSADGPAGAGYGIRGNAVWSPDGTWAVVDEGRLVVMTATSDPPLTRVLSDEQVRGGDGLYPTFAVTSRPLLR